MDETKVLAEILLSLILLAACSVWSLRSITQDMAKLSIANDYNDKMSMTSALELCEYPENAFECGLRHCISKDKLCDGYSDCPNNSDEELSTCFADINNAIEPFRAKREDSCNFHCRSGECLGSMFLCDGLPHCSDGSDETEKECGRVVCPSFSFRCKYGACIPQDVVCNGEANCADGSDEAPFECAKLNSSGACHSYEFHCRDGGCVDKLQVCDGFRNCEDGSDERVETCGDINCPNYLFKCSYGACVTRNARCNHTEECVDASDERDCDFGIPPEMSLTSSGCLLPRHPAHGEYEVKNMETYLESTYVRSGIKLNLKCMMGYVPSTLFSFTCTYNTWNPILDQGRCLRSCPPLDDSGKYTAYCSLNQQWIDCRNSVEGTIATIICKSYPNTTKMNSSLVCLSSGIWSQEIQSCEGIAGLDSNCILPAHPRHGKYKLVDGGVYRENTKTSSPIMLVCDPNYQRVKPYLTYFHCYKGQWSLQIEEDVCLSTCSALNDTSYYATCELNGQRVKCENPVENTRANLKCEPYYTSHSAKVILSCQKGEWDPPPTPCQPECGQKNVNADVLVVGGNDTVEGEYPWVVVIYNSFQNNLQICSGSIISRYYVLSAAHCFTDNQGMPNNKDFFTIVAGKYYRDLAINETDTQVRKIKKLLLHEDYGGRRWSYYDDIALIEVDEKFKLTEKVQLICIDWDRKQHSFLMNEEVVVTGWGYTKEASEPSKVLKKLVVPIRSRPTCKKHLEKSFRIQYYGRDKICAGYYGIRKGVCTGDSGGGLYARRDGSTYYLIGITSMTQQSESGCDSRNYALYTKLSRYLKWLTTNTRRRL